MLKPLYRQYGQKGPFSSAKEKASLVLFWGEDEFQDIDVGPEPMVPKDHWERNSVKLLRMKLSHLERDFQEGMLKVLGQFPSVFRQLPGLTTWATHDIDVEKATPVKLPPYRVNPQKQQLLDEELKYMLQHRLIERVYSKWSSPVTL